jgi:amino-acid N-acetyltransferase
MTNPTPTNPAAARTQGPGVDLAADGFVRWFRHATPYVHAHRGRTFVIAFGGEAVADKGFRDLVHDLAMLHGLGIRLVLVHGARPQIQASLARRGAGFRYVNGLRVTDAEALVSVKEAAGTLRVWRYKQRANPDLDYPPWTTCGRTVLYPVDGLHAYLERRTVGR